MKKPVKICFAVIVFLAILTGSVVLVLNLRSLYRLDISRFGLEEVSGLSADRIKANYDALIDYNLLWHREPLVFPDLPMSETARIHFEEVKRIFDLFQAVFLAAGAASLVILIRQRDRNKSWLKITGILSIVFPVLAGGLALIGWDTFFETFHRLVFNNDYWLFDPATDPIILLLPDGYFFQCAILIAAVMLALGAVCLAAGIRQGKDRRGEKARQSAARPGREG